MFARIHSQREKVRHKTCFVPNSKTVQSFQFLVDVSEFQSSFHHAQRSEEGRHDDFNDFIRIVNEYIKDNSSSEVNIDCTTRSAILAFVERSEYESLDAVRTGELSERKQLCLLPTLVTTCERRVRVG